MTMIRKMQEGAGAAAKRITFVVSGVTKVISLWLSRYRNDASGSSAFKTQACVFSHALSWQPIGQSERSGLASKAESTFPHMAKRNDQD